MKAALALSLAAAVLATPQTAPSAEGHDPIAEGTVALSASYDGVLVVKVLDLAIEQQVSDDSFTANARLKSHGVLSVFKKIDVAADARGAVDQRGPRPAAFNHVNNDGKANRRVRVNWTGASVTTEARPAYPDMGAPPATSAQKLAAADPLTQLTRLAIQSGIPCTTPTRFFDGRQLYEVEFSQVTMRAPTAREQALGLGTPVRCALAFREVAGFDAKPPGRGNQGLKGPITIDFARTPQQGPWIVYAVRGQTPLGEARIELKTLTVRAA